MDELSLLFLLSIIALICEYIDSALGGGYGTILTPVLLLLGFEISLIVPTILFTEFWSGLISAIMHHRVGNADFSKIQISDADTSKKYLKFSEDAKISFILSLCGIVGAIVAVIVVINIPTTIVKTYIGILVMLVGLLVFVNAKWKFSWAKMGGIGLLAAFNKGLSGGGYGPLVSSGQIIVDRNPKNAIATTSLSESIVCLAALIVYSLTGTITINIPFQLAILTGALGSVPFAVLTVKKIKIKKFQPLIGVTTFGLGALTLVKTWIL